MGRASRSYASGAPWVFRGDALYQLQLVKSEVARPLIPKGLKLVEAFGYTLGGFFLARYDESPSTSPGTTGRGAEDGDDDGGGFHELVMMAGLVWNPPTSCAWAAKVFVDSPDAMAHGRAQCGLPSRLGAFAHGPARLTGAAAVRSVEVRSLELSDSETGRWVAGFDLPRASGIFRRSGDERRRGASVPRTRMLLPSFSGCTEHRSDMLRYGCDMHARVKPTFPCRVRVGDGADGERGLLGGRPLLCLAFDDMEMVVDAPVVVAPDPARNGAILPLAEHVQPAPPAAPA